MKLKCPKCGNDTFKISITERQITRDDPSGLTRLRIIQILNITCALTAGYHYT